MRHLATTAATLATLLAVQVPGQTGGGRLEDPATGKPFIRYHVTAPGSVPAGKRLGLIVGLHGTNGNESSLTGPISQALRALKLQKDYVVLGLKSKTNKWTPADDEPIKKAIAWALTTYRIDPRRVYGWGYSSGGLKWGGFTFRNPELIAGAVQMGSGGGPGGRGRTVEGRLPGSGQPRIYLMGAENDERVSTKITRALHRRLTQVGILHVYREISGLDHWGLMVQSAPIRVDAMAWIHSFRNGAVPPTGADAELLQEVADLLARGESPTANDLDAVAAISGPEAADVIATACLSQDAKARLAAARACTRWMPGPEVIPALATLLDDTSKTVRQTALDALGRAASWNNADAQAALGRRAADSDLTTADRVAAIRQLGRAMPIEHHCSYGNRTLIAPLVDLLMDPSKTIRAAAFEALMGRGARTLTPHTTLSMGKNSQHGGFGYHPAAKESSRAAAVERWRQWLER